MRLSLTALVLSGLAAVAALSGCNGQITNPLADRPAATTTADPDSIDEDGGGSAGPSYIKFTLCAQGNFPSYAVVTEGGSRLATVKPGGCAVQTLVGSQSDYHVQIWGVDTAGTPFRIGIDAFTPDSDERVRTTGTVGEPDWTAY